MVGGLLGSPNPDLARDLVWGDMVATPVKEDSLGHDSPRFQEDFPCHNVTVSLMPFTPDTGGRDIRMIPEESFNLFRIGLQPKDIDHLFFQSGQCQIVLVIETADVAGLKPPIDKGVLGPFGPVQISGKEV